jgi:hypothetical protein
MKTQRNGTKVCKSPCFQDESPDCQSTGICGTRLKLEMQRKAVQTTRENFVQKGESRWKCQLLMNSE